MHILPWLAQRSSLTQKVLSCPIWFISHCRLAVNVPGMHVHVYTRVRIHAVVSAFVKLIISCDYQHLGDERAGKWADLHFKPWPQCPLVSLPCFFLILWCSARMYFTSGALALWLLGWVVTSFSTAAQGKQVTPSQLPQSRFYKEKLLRADESREPEFNLWDSQKVRRKAGPQNHCLAFNTHHSMQWIYRCAHCNKERI